MSLARLARLRRRARLVLTIEALAVASLWPAGAITLFLIACLLGFGGWQADLAGLVALGFSIRHARHAYRPPAPAAIDRRIERDSGLAHRPIAALEDHPALIGTEAAPLWQAHRLRLERAIAGARVAWPAPDFAEHDPYALRMLLLLVLLAAWIAAGQDAGQRLAVSLRMPALFSTAGIGVQAWITPPRWAGLPPRLVNPGKQAVEALAGSTLSLIVTGAGSGAPTARLDGKSLRFATIDTGSYRTHHLLDHTTTLVIGSYWHRIAKYQIQVITPTAPEIGFARPPVPDSDGRRTDIAWTGTSRYGLNRVSLGMVPVNTNGAITDEAALPAHQQGDDIGGSAKLNLLASPFAGMKVKGALAATNRNGQTGTSAPAIFTLPAPVLHNKTAEALELVRRELGLNRVPRAELGQRLKALAADPPGLITPETRTAITKFATGFGARKPDHAQAEASLWELVQRAELGANYRSAQRLAAARHALERALERALAGHPLERHQLDQLLARLNKAMQAHLAAQAHTQAQANNNARSMQMSAIDKLVRQIEHDAASGNTEQARREMDRLRQMLSELQNARPETAMERAQRQAAQETGQRLSQIMRSEASLLNRTMQQNRQPQPGNRAMPQANPANQHLADQQLALQQQLAAAMQAMAAAGLKPPSQVGHGLKAMSGAHGHLQQGDMAGAIPAERAAIHALQQAQNAMQSSQGGQGPGGGMSGLGQQAVGGRGEFGNQSESNVSLGRAGSRSDARHIQNELIRRDAKPDLPQSAHRYYGRLLGNQF